MIQNESNQVQTVASTPGATRITGWLTIVVGTILVVCIAYAVFEGIHSRVEAKAELRQVALNSAIPSVNVVYPKGGAEAEEIELPGNTQAFTDTPIYSRTNGYVKDWYVDIGARVKQGQLLAVIETPELDRQLRQAKADLKNAEANMQIADITATRWQNLLKTDSVSHQEADQAVSSLHSKEALVDSSRANVERLEQLQSFERIIAPVDGVITARNTDIGALIQADTTAPKEIFHLSAIQQLRIYVPVPEVYAPSVKTGDKVSVTLDAFPGQNFWGTLVRNANSIDSTARTLNVEVDVDNTSGRLMPGAYAFVHFKVPSTHGAVTIPSNALLFRTEGLRVGIVRNSHVALVPITVGQDYGDAVEVLSGLTGRDAVIVNPSDSLANGAQVQVENNGVQK
jgi:RND family efflux transporter MFP subunit